jgi:tetratricopeptide (TPR) repeat protein
MSEIAEVNCIEEKDKRLSLALNIAEIQVKREKKNEAREIFDKNLTLAGDVYTETSVDFDNYLTSLIKLSNNEVSNEKFEQYALKRVQVKKNIFGIESYEAVYELARMAEFYRRLKEFEKAELYYSEAIAVSDKMVSNEKIQKLAIVSQYRAYLLERYGKKEGRRKDDEFVKNRTQIYTTSDNRQILNGRAIKLHRPVISEMLSQAVWDFKANGKVEVSITIGEDGKVIDAKVISGHQLLREPSERAAKLSTFLPTYIDKKPVKVTGVIVYNFDR